MRRNWRLVKIFPLLIAAFIIINPAIAHADLSADQYSAYHEGILYFNTEDCNTSSGVAPGTLPKLIPEPYNGAFTQGGNNHKVSPALVAAIFTEENMTHTAPSQLPNTWQLFAHGQYGGSHQPVGNVNTGWPSSPAGATGPFQFLPSTWTGLGYNIAGINNLAKAADAAADYLAKNGGTTDKSPESPAWQAAIFAYNHAQWYVDAVLLYYHYYSTGDPSVVVPNPSSTTSSSCSNSSTSNPSGPCQSPFRDIKNLRPERIDQGVDYAGTGPVYAVCPGVITDTTNAGWDYGGFDAFITIKIKGTGTPADGKVSYMAEGCLPNVHTGQQVDTKTKICDLICNTSNIDTCTGIETGWAVPPGDGQPLAQLYGGNGSCTTALGVNYNQFLKSLNTPSGINECAPTLGRLPPGWPSW